MRKGDWFVITEQRHFAFRQVFVVTKTRNESILGHDTILDLGQMVFFKIDDAEHSVPVEWTRRTERPDFRRRLK